MPREASSKYSSTNQQKKKIYFESSTMDDDNAIVEWKTLPTCKLRNR